MRLEACHRTALVTGARSGLGAAFTAALVDAGVQVWGTSRAPERVETRAGLRVLPLELADPRTVTAAWGTAERESGGIDLLVNNAGQALFGAADVVTADEAEREAAVLWAGPVRLARLAVAAMRARGHGTIVNVTSLAVELPIPLMSGYNSAKAALAAFSASLLDETAGTGVSVIDFRPGDYRTEFDAALLTVGQPAANGSRDARIRSRLAQLSRLAPPPDRAARDLLRALRRGRTGVVRSGSFFQARVAPWGNRLLPGGWMRLLRSFYFRNRS